MTERDCTQDVEAPHGGDTAQTSCRRPSGACRGALDAKARAPRSLLPAVLLQLLLFLPTACSFQLTRLTMMQKQPVLRNSLLGSRPHAGLRAQRPLAPQLRQQPGALSAVAVGDKTTESAGPHVMTNGDFLSTLVTVGRFLEGVDEDALEPLKTLTVEQVILLSKAAEKSKIGWEKASSQQQGSVQSAAQTIDQSSAEAFVPVETEYEKVEVSAAPDEVFLPPPRNLPALSVLSDEAALFAAAKDGRMDAVRRLAARGGRALIMSPANNIGDTCLHGAAQEGQLAVVEFLLDRAGKACLLKPNDYGETALHLAARAGHLDVVKLLASKGGIELLKSRDKTGSTALHTAAYKLRLEVIRFLAKRGGKDLLLAVDNRGRSALFNAVFYEDNDMLKHLESDHALDVISFLVDAGGHRLLELKGQVQDTLTGDTLPSSYTPLGIAEQQGNSNMVLYLEEAMERLGQDTNHGGLIQSLKDARSFM